MRLLVIDTALGACTAAVFEDARLLAAQFLPMTKGHQERLGGVVRDVVAEAGGGFDALDRIGVTVGPGSFTGLRVGLAFAQGLGAALDRPVVGISALDGLAGSLPEDGSPVAALIDARRGQVYIKLFVNGLAAGPDEALTLEEAAQRVAALGPDVRLVGNGAPVLIDAFPDVKHALLDDRVAPSPEALARLAAAADPATDLPKPLYLRAPDATPPSRLPGQPRQPAPPTAT
ncbi:tRNA threonylcarbamoyladenosine biosynthesis protein TsaB [Brevundimonas nasdae]|uniref:tRNA (adenosine(37)-N6)-threonylcarbamoyltransferase complex dimerization subunit type 1 TsaB n=1 Tax=Brevundimonas nasdae TaxID=172043 RepID=UPI0019140A51|nr:tRNA (adenosine(37)-N6)-threonylcarbamoyltransferase complex dimerization subunit type 1 TsaB [Brevundimonas nasdae]MBK6024662.1 tRNA (adenosine(37)-N6)-threonylcarbamoyltransferase complex dimerization subunit type 1 TsaB [Brevundimonas nasdae]MDQ0451375.1 tRNA threonylcarbamoyladenosine biosynthesis protein TsaB [Brevundimonas nasdae]